MDLTEQINQLEADLLELGSLLEKAERKRVQELLKQEQQKVEKELSVKRQQKEKQAMREADRPLASKGAYTVKINSYDVKFEKCEHFVVLFLPTAEFRLSVDLHCTLGSICLLLVENRATDSCDRLFSLQQIKTDMILVMCKKQATKKWECLTTVEKQSKEKDKPNIDESADPSDGLMTMLKKIYSEGDDEMKRTINKAWSESQEKKIRGGGEDMMDI
ncbi:calcyclin-binding protein [Perca fluviatilis]|uniref:calcyclin-binding protein n=1 Tax=Perca fluviatilis TaxID=8168 RepID=UPI001964CD9C|nr:calcyclin-binding protein [Perca fluviatilis]